MSHFIHKSYIKKLVTVARPDIVMMLKVHREISLNQWYWERQLLIWWFFHEQYQKLRTQHHGLIKHGCLICSWSLEIDSQRE